MTVHAVGSDEILKVKWIRVRIMDLVRF